MEYNKIHHITPRQIVKEERNILSRHETLEEASSNYGKPSARDIANDPVIANMTRAQLEKSVESSRIQMERAAKELDFNAAAKFRDEMNALRGVLKNKKK